MAKNDDDGFERFVMICTLIMIICSIALAFLLPWFVSVASSIG